jgi:hypothetical protein
MGVEFQGLVHEGMRVEAENSATGTAGEETVGTGRPEKPSRADDVEDFLTMNRRRRKEWEMQN